MNNCKRCNNEFKGNYCPNCGKPLQLKRISGQYIIEEIGSVLNFDKGILYTIKELVLRPGYCIKEFIYEDRNRLTKPIIFLIFCTLTLTLVNQIFKVDIGSLQDDLNNLNPGVKKIANWIGRFNGFGIILRGFFIGFATKLFFRKSGFNIYEIFILIFFISGIVNLIFAIFRIIESLVGFYSGSVSFLFGLVYSAWAIGSFFNKSKISSYIKGFFVYFLGSGASYIFIVSIGNLINFFIKSS